MYYALVRKSDSIVENVIILKDGDAWPIPDGYLLIKSDEASKNDFYDGKNFIKNFANPEPLSIEQQLTDLKETVSHLVESQIS